MRVNTNKRDRTTSKHSKRALLQPVANNFSFEAHDSQPSSWLTMSPSVCCPTTHTVSSFPPRVVRAMLGQPSFCFVVALPGNHVQLFLGSIWKMFQLVFPAVVRTITYCIMSLHRFDVFGSLSLIALMDSCRCETNINKTFPF